MAKHEGISVRHSRSCRTQTDKEARCNCNPRYVAWVYSKRDKKKVYQAFPTLAAAKGWRSDAGTSVRKGALRATSSPTLRDAGEAWLDACERGEILSRHRKPYKPSALRGYRQDLSRYVYNDFGALKLTELTADDLQGLIDRLTGMGLSGSKVRNVLVPLQALYRRYRRQVLVDPTDGLDLPEPGQRRERVAQPQEAASLLDALPDEDRALWATAFYAGLRLGELQAIRVSDVEPDGCVIHVRRNWDRKVGEIEPKSKAGYRDVPAPEALRNLLVAHVERTGRRGDDFLFGRTASAPFTDSHMRDRARAAWVATAVGSFVREQSSNLEPIGFHESRHSYSSYLDAAGISETRADRYMGHSNSSMRARYTHQLERQWSEDAATLDAYLSAASSGKVVQLPTGTHSGTQAAQSRMAASGA